MAKATGNKATETKTSTAIALVIPEQNAIAKGVGIKILNSLYEDFNKEAKITELKLELNYRKNEALATLTKVLFDAASANKDIYRLFTGAFKSDRKVQAMANDTAKALLDMGTFNAENTFVESKEVKAKFARDKKADTAEFKKGDYAYKNFSTQMKTAMKNAVGAVDLEFDAVEMDKDAGTLAISGPAAEQIWGSDTVILNNANKEQSLPDEVDGKKTPEASMKTIRELAEKKHSDKPAAPAVTSTKGTTVVGGNTPAAVREACNHMIAMLNSLKDWDVIDSETTASLLSVANALRPFLSELNPAARATDSARAASAATQVVKGVTLATSAGKAKGKVKAEAPAA